jgi:hypothetical protein
MSLPAEGVGGVAASAAAVPVALTHDSDDEDCYVVDRLDGVQVIDGVRRFLVVWKGYDDEEDNTWEPESNLTQELINTCVFYSVCATLYCVH